MENTCSRGKMPVVIYYLALVKKILQSNNHDLKVTIIGDLKRQFYSQNIKFNDYKSFFFIFIVTKWLINF